jgi:hypothetical protein
VEGAQLVTQRSGAARDEAQNRDRIVGRVVDEAVLGERRHDDGRNACIGAPAVTLQRGDVIPDATVLVIGDDDQHVVPLRAVFQIVYHVDDVLITRNNISIARMFVDVVLIIVKLHNIFRYKMWNKIGDSVPGSQSFLCTRLHRGPTRNGWLITVYRNLCSTQGVYYHMESVNRCAANGAGVLT